MLPLALARGNWPARASWNHPAFSLPSDFAANGPLPRDALRLRLDLLSCGSENFCRYATNSLPLASRYNRRADGDLSVMDEGWQLRVIVDEPGFPVVIRIERGVHELSASMRLSQRLVINYNRGDDQDGNGCACRNGRLLLNLISKRHSEPHQ